MEKDIRTCKKCAKPLGEWLGQDDRIRLIGGLGQQYEIVFNHLTVICGCGERKSFRSEIMKQLEEAKDVMSWSKLLKSAYLKGYPLEINTVFGIEPADERKILKTFTQKEREIYDSIKAISKNSGLKRTYFAEIAKKLGMTEKAFIEKRQLMISKIHAFMRKLDEQGKLDR